MQIRYSWSNMHAKRMKYRKLFEDVEQEDITFIRPQMQSAALAPAPTAIKHVLNESMVYVFDSVNEYLQFVIC